jgi:hypothetical protein
VQVLGRAEAEQLGGQPPHDAADDHQRDGDREGQRQRDDRGEEQEAAQRDDVGVSDAREA